MCPARKCCVNVRPGGGDVPGLGGGGLTLEGWVHRLGPPRQDAVDGFIYQLPGAWSSRLLPHSFLTPENLGGWAQARSKAACSPQGLPIWEPGTVTAWPGASWSTVEELSFGPKAHRAPRLRDQRRWADGSVRDRKVMLRTHLCGPARLLRKMIRQTLLLLPFHTPGIQIPR